MKTITNYFIVMLMFLDTQIDNEIGAADSLDCQLHKTV